MEEKVINEIKKLKRLNLIFDYYEMLNILQCTKDNDFGIIPEYNSSSIIPNVCYFCLGTFECKKDNLTKYKIYVDLENDKIIKVCNNIANYFEEKYKVVFIDDCLAHLKDSLLMAGTNIKIKEVYTRKLK